MAMPAEHVVPWHVYAVLTSLRVRMGRGTVGLSRKRSKLFTTHGCMLKHQSCMSEVQQLSAQLCIKFYDRDRNGAYINALGVNQIYSGYSGLVLTPDFGRSAEISKSANVCIDSDNCGKIWTVQQGVTPLVQPSVIQICFYFTLCPCRIGLCY